MSWTKSPPVDSGSRPCHASIRAWARDPFLRACVWSWAFLGDVCVQGVDNVGDLFFGHAGIQRNRKLRARDPLGNGERSLPKPEVNVSLLQMDGRRVVDLRLDALPSEMVLQPVPRLAEDRKDVLHARFIERWQVNHFVVDAFVVRAGDRPPSLVPLIQVGELSEQDGSLYFVETGVHALVDVFVLPMRAVVAQCAYLFGRLFVVGDDSTGIAERPEVFAWVEAEGGGIANVSRHVGPVTRAVRLCGVLEEEQSVLLCNGPGPLDLGELAVEVYDEYRLGGRRDGRLDLAWIHEQCVQVAVDKDGRRACVAHRQRGGDEGVGGHDDLVARSNTIRLEHESERVEAVARADAVMSTAVTSEGVLERLEPGTLDEPLAFVDAVHSLSQLVLDGLVHTAEVRVGDLHQCTSSTYVRKSL